MVSEAALDESAELRSAYRAVWRIIALEEKAAIDDPRRHATAARLNRLRRFVEAELKELDSRTARWVRDNLRRIYEYGARVTVIEAGTGFTWTAFHEQAFKIQATDTYDDLLRATRHVRADVKRFIRKATRLRALRATVGETAAQQARALAAEMRARGIAAIVYRNGRAVPLDTYAEMVLRTKTAVAYNEGTLNLGHELGIKYYEVFDGPECGWSFHNSMDLALGKIVLREDALAFPISHPNCRRAFGPRPDIITKEDLMLARGGQTTRSQASAQRAQDARRRAAQGRRRARRIRSSAGRRT